jgi:hypothetical protein
VATIRLENEIPPPPPQKKQRVAVRCSVEEAQNYRRKWTTRQDTWLTAPCNNHRCWIQPPFAVVKRAGSLQKLILRSYKHKCSTFINYGCNSIQYLFIWHCTNDKYTVGSVLTAQHISQTNDFLRINNFNVYPSVNLIMYLINDYSNKCMSTCIKHNLRISCAFLCVLIWLICSLTSTNNAAELTKWRHGATFDTNMTTINKYKDKVTPVQGKKVYEGVETFVHSTSTSANRKASGQLHDQGRSPPVSVH